MRSETSAQIKEHLNNLSDVFGARPPSPGALKVWTSAMKDVDEKFILQAFVLWPDHNRKMPAPADIRADAFKLQEEWRQRERELDKAQFSSSPMEPRRGTNSPAVIAAFKRHQALIAYASKHTPDDQWQWNLLDKYVNNKPNPDGTKLYACQIDMLHRCFGNPIPQKVIDELPERMRRDIPIPPFKQILDEEIAKENA